ncbi:MAG TPA: phage tail tape measure C-terminal domain-containing protein [Candidatus Krumholzibacteria bacterium]|nr:phage tail tape measure C-terminal domain-containing protein [Candidatus Krumholzibacteria bacterium]HRY42068.1 phage tail tape measure C-terminal domain-containing protein [Candidatus Krumholzibacteria bacterium]
MATPDVRVRLSAEGVAEVVAALKKVQTEAENASAKQSRGFLGLNRVLGSTSTLLSGLGVALGVGQFQQWIRSSVDAADRIDELGQTVGASTENLSALSMLARTSAASLEEMGAALARQNKFIGEAAAGNSKATATLRALGLTLADFKGKDSVQIFELIAQRIAALPSPIQKTKTAMDIFGRSGANLIPTMDALASEGLGAVIERARELGVLIDGRLAQSAAQMNDDFELLKTQSEGLGARLAAGLVPQLSQALQIMSGDLKQTTEAWERFGQGIGLVVKFIVAVVSSAFDIVGSALAMIMMRIDAGVRAAWALLHGNLDEAKTFVRTAVEAIGAERSALEDRLKARFELTVSKPPEPAARPQTPVGEVAEDPATLEARRVQAMQATLDRELALVRAAASLRTSAEKRGFDEGLKDVQAYYAERRRIADEEHAKEIEVLQQKRALLDSEPDPSRRSDEQGKLDAELAKARLEYEVQTAALLADERDAVQKLAEERLALERTLLEAQGRRHEAALLGIDEEIRRADLMLKKQGASDAEREATLARMRRSMESSANFDETKRQADAALADLDATRAEIEARVSAGLLSQVEGEQQILAIEAERLVALQSLATALEQAAWGTGDPERIAQAQGFTAAVRDLGHAVEGARVSFVAFGRTALDSGRDALTEFFDTGITGAKSLGDAFRNLALSIIADLKRMAAQLLATAIIKKIAGVFGSGGQVGGAEKKAVGGVLGGLGTGTSDSNLAWFSRGEYLVRAAVVREPGVLRHLDELNRRGAQALVQTPMLIEAPVPRFAEGGLVDGPAPADPQASKDSQVLIGLEEGLILRHLESPAGQRILVKAMAKNRRAIRSALGT